VNSGKCIIIGAGNIGLKLIQSLSSDFSLVCIDTNEEALAAARKARGSDLETFSGDATSRLFLEKAGVGEAETVVITITDEKANLEIARILKEHFQIRRTLAVGITAKGIRSLEEMEVEVEGIFSISAIGLRNRLEHKTKTVHGIGLEKNEIMEVEVHPNSRLTNKPLSSIHPANWRAGIIYRDGNIIVPEDRTVLKPKDKVVILGEPQELKTVAEILTFRFEHFPLEYGDTAIVYCEGDEKDHFFEEVSYLFSVFPLSRAIFATASRDPEITGRLQRLADERGLRHVEILPASKSPLQALESAMAEKGRRTGLVVLSQPKLHDSFFAFSARAEQKGFLRKLSDRASCPILLAGGSFPYEKVAVPCLDVGSLQHSLETALEMSSSLHHTITALLAEPHRYIASPEETVDFEGMKKTAADLSTAYKTGVDIRELKGNPIREVTGELKEFDLMVNDIGTWRSGGWWRFLFRPDISWNIVRNSQISTLIIPPLRELV